MISVAQVMGLASHLFHQINSEKFSEVTASSDINYNNIDDILLIIMNNNHE